MFVFAYSLTAITQLVNHGMIFVPARWLHYFWCWHVRNGERERRQPIWPALVHLQVTAPGSHPSLSLGLGSRSIRGSSLRALARSSSQYHPLESVCTRNSLRLQFLYIIMQLNSLFGAYIVLIIFSNLMRFEMSYMW